MGKRISERERKRENLGTNLGGKREKKAKIHRKLVDFLVTEIIKQVDYVFTVSIRC